MKKEFYYIQNGYVGNAVAWWGINSCGYTTDIEKAGKYSKSDAQSICRDQKEARAWESNYIDKNEEAKKLVIDSQYLKYKYSRKWRVGRK